MQRQGYFIFIVSVIVGASIASAIVSALTRKKLPEGTISVRLPAQGDATAPGARWSRALIVSGFGIGMVLLFLTLALCIASAWDKVPPWCLVSMPRAISLGGYCLLVLYYGWGVSVIGYNVNYTPCYKPISGQYRIATAGPYALVKHPMYAAKAAFPLIMFCITGFVPFLAGLISWVALPYQARMEEARLLQLGGDEYRCYAERTGRFFPRIHRRFIKVPGSAPRGKREPSPEK